MSATRAPINIRPLRREDIPLVADLRRRIFGEAGPSSPKNIEPYLTEIFFNHPWTDEALPSLVYEDHGRIIGCLGVLSRRMRFSGRPIHAAVTHHFMVEPGRRSTLAGLRLARTFLSGPQDLSMAEGSDTSRKIWEGCGGTTSLLYSLHWTRLLRPACYVLSFLQRRGMPGAFVPILRPFCHLLDHLTRWVPRKPFRLSKPSVSAGELDVETLHACFSEFSHGRLLQPVYDDHSLRWLLERLDQKNGRGALQKAAVRNAAREMIGWYLYYLNPGGLSEVVQIAAKPGSIHAVLDHLFYHAQQGGAVAVSGQLDPAFFPAFSDQYCLFHHGKGAWMLLHSKHPELLQAVHRGDAFLTRLEGEWWIGF
jgi:hypothetical protein